MKYKIFTLTGEGFSQIPPKWTSLIFPAFAGEQIETQADELVVTFAAETQVNPFPGLIVQKLNPQTNIWETL